MKYFFTLFVVCCFSVLEGTHGYVFSGYGARSVGMGGVGVAYPQDSIVASLNPAGMASVGSRFDAGFTVFNPNRGYHITAEGGRSFRSGQQIFGVPHLGYNLCFFDHCSVGISVYSNGGLNTNYGQNNNVFGEGKLSIDYAQLIAAPTLACCFCTGCIRHSFGFSFLGAFQRIKVRGLQNFAAFSESPNDVSNKGYDTSTGYSWRVGYLAVMRQWVSAGFSWSPKFDMEPFGRYRGLFARHGKLDIPATWMTGVAVHPPSGRWHIAFDLQRVYYAKVTALGNPFQLIFNPETPLGADGGPGFGWKNVWIYKLGADYCLGRCLVIRAGFATNNSVYASSQVVPNIVSPAVVKAHLTIGGTLTICKLQFDIAYGHAINSRVRGDDSGLGLGVITESMNQNYVTISYGHCY